MSAKDVPNTGSVPIWTTVVMPRPASLTAQGTVPDCPPLREMTPTGPGTNTLLANSGLPPSQPAAAIPGLMMPMEPGPSKRTPFCFA